MPTILALLVLSILMPLSYTKEVPIINDENTDNALISKNELQVISLDKSHDQLEHKEFTVSDDDDDFQSDSESESDSYLLRFLPHLDLKYYQRLAFSGSFNLDNLAGADLLPQNGTLSHVFNLQEYCPSSVQPENEDHVAFTMRIDSFTTKVVVDSQEVLDVDSNHPDKCYPIEFRERFQELLEEILHKGFKPMDRMRNGRAQKCMALSEDHHHRMSKKTDEVLDLDLCVTPLMGNLFYSDDEVKVGETWSESYSRVLGPEDENFVPDVAGIHLSIRQEFKLDRVEEVSQCQGCWCGTVPPNVPGRTPPGTPQGPEAQEIGYISGSTTITVGLPDPSGLWHMFACTVKIRSEYEVDMVTGVPRHWALTGTGSLPASPFINLTFRFLVTSDTNDNYVEIA